MGKHSSPTGDGRPNPTQQALLDGGRIGDYQIESLLGAGGMGEVYKAWDPHLDRHVAIKVIRPAVADETGFAERFKREARTASTIAHRNVAQVFAAGVEGTMPYYVMELVDGASLKDEVDQEGPLSSSRALSFLMQAAEGLAAAFDEGVVHRDIKPANLMVAGSDLKIVDFGLAKTLDSDSSITQTGSFIGTPAFLAPEQALESIGQADAPPIDHRADIYSLGATFYLLASGRPPFDAPTPTAVLLKVANERPTPLSERNPQVTPELALLIEKMMAKHPAHRHQTYEQLLADIARAQSGRALASATSDIGGAAAPPPSFAPLRGGAASAAERPALLQPWAIAVGLFAIVLLAALWFSRDQPPVPPTVPEGRSDPLNESYDPVAPLAESLRDPGSLIGLAQKTQTQANMRQLNTYVEVYIAERGEPPASLNEIQQEMQFHPKALLDAWGQPILFEPKEGYRFRLISVGRDGGRGSADDIVLEDGYFND